MMVNRLKITIDPPTRVLIWRCWRIEKRDSDDDEVSDGSDTDSWHRHQISALISFFSYLQQTHFLFTSYNMNNMK